MKFTRPNDRIIVALDVPNVRTACETADRLHSLVGGFKMGFELILATLADLLSPQSYDSVRAFAALQELSLLVQGKLFLDVKLKDIKNTVEGAARQIARLNPKSFNLHSDGSFQMMQGAVAAIRAANSTAKVWAVTLLTDMNYTDLDDLEDLPLQPDDSPEIKARVLQTVLRRAARAQRAGLDGVIASAQEARGIREQCGDEFEIVTPAIRPLWAAVGDQKRPTTPADAIGAGANYLVIGRPILKPPAEVGTPERAIELICEEIEKAAA